MRQRAATEGTSGLAIGLNLLFLSPEAGGIGRYAVELLKALPLVGGVSRLVAFIGRDVPPELEHSAQVAGVELVRIGVHAAERARLAAEVALLPLLAIRHRLNVLHSLANVGPPFAPGVATVVTLHDLIWLRYGEDWGPRRAIQSMRLLVAVSVRTANRVVTDSTASKNDIVRLLRIPSEQVDVVPLGAATNDGAGSAESDLRGRLGIDHRSILLCVAQLRPYKNLARLISAFASLHRDDVALVIVGQPTEHGAELVRFAERQGVSRRVVFAGWVSENDLITLYRTAAAFVLPSLVEGFGLPVLEAMRSGLPVACSNDPALSEMAAGAALLFDPSDEAAIRRSLARLLNDEALAARLRAQGRRRAEQFTWERTARETVASYRRAVGSSSRTNLTGSSAKLR